MKNPGLKIGKKIENSWSWKGSGGETRYTPIGRRKIASEVACARLHKRIQWDERGRGGGVREKRNKKKVAGSERGREEKAARWGSPAGTNNGRQNAVGHPLPSFLKRREIGLAAEEGWSGPVTVKISVLNGQR